MRKQVLSGIILIVGAPVLLLVSYWLRVVSDLPYAGQEIVIVIVTVMFCTGVSLIWNGRKSDEQETLRKQEIHAAIKKWVELPVTGFRDKQDVYPLIEKPPELAVEIEDCLRRKYPSIWASLQELRNKYAELMALKGNIPAEFLVQKDDKVTTFHLSAFEAHKESIRHPLVAMQRQLIQQINSEIVQKHSTRLKC